MQKTVDNSAPSEGDTVVYSVVITNNGPGDATGIEVTDTLPAGVTYVSDNSASLLDSSSTPTSYASGTGVWTVGDLNNGESLTLEITATVDAATSGTTITNVAELTNVDQADSNTTNNQDSADIIVGAVDIEVQKTVDNTTPDSGDDITYTITVTNNGPSDATGVQIDEDLPLDGVSLTYVSDTPSKGTFTVGTPGTWDIGDLANGETVTLQLTVTIEIPSGSISNTASLASVDQTDSDSTNNSDTASFTLGGIDLAVQKTVSNPTPEMGDNVVYTIVARNIGSNTATGVVVSDILPAGVTYVSDDSATVNDSTSTPTSFDDTTGDWTIGQMDAGESLTLHITVTVNIAGGVITNTADISGNETEADTTNNHDEATIAIDSADLSLSKTVDNNTPDVGDTIHYTLTVRNDGPNDAVNVEVTDTLPAAVNYTGTYTASQGSFDGSVWTVGNISVGNAATLEITVEVTGTTGTVNVAEVTASDQPDVDSTPNNGVTTEDDYAESTFGFDPPFGRKVFDANGLPLLEWTMVWVNPNPTPLSVTVSDDIASGTAYVAGSLTCTSPGVVVVTSCTYDALNNRVVFTGTLMPSPGATLADAFSVPNRLEMTFRVTVDGSVSQVRNVGNLTAAGAGSARTNTAVVDINKPSNSNDNGGQSPAEIEINKSVQPEIAFPGQTLSWFIEVHNPGTATAFAAVVNDTLPDVLTINSTSASTGSVSVTGQSISWTIGDVGTGRDRIAGHQYDRRQRSLRAGHQRRHCQRQQLRECY